MRLLFSRATWTRLNLIIQRSKSNYNVTCNFCLDGCMDGLVAVLRPFQQYFSHIRTMEG